MPPLSPDTLYSQISENLRASDDFSFKLLGLVPLSTLLLLWDCCSKRKFNGLRVFMP
jgi:hypothetical protein